jgi:hypothetical protein
VNIFTPVISAVIIIGNYMKVIHYFYILCYLFSFLFPLSNTIDPQVILEFGGLKNEQFLEIKITSNQETPFQAFQFDIDGILASNILENNKCDKLISLHVNRNNILGVPKDSLFQEISECVFTVDVKKILKNQLCFKNFVFWGVNGNLKAESGDCYKISGCMDRDACNYYRYAMIDNGTCEYPDCNGKCNGSAYYDLCGDCITRKRVPNFSDEGCGCNMPSPVDYYFDIDGDGLGDRNRSSNFCVELGIETENTWGQLLPETGWVSNSNDLCDCEPSRVTIGSIAKMENGKSNITIKYYSEYDFYGAIFDIENFIVETGEINSNNHELYIHSKTNNLTIYTWSYPRYLFSENEGILITLSGYFQEAGPICIKNVDLVYPDNIGPAVTAGPCKLP